MSCLLSALLLALHTLWPMSAQSGRSVEGRGEEIARQVQDRDTGRDSRSMLRMRLHDRRGRVRDRALDLMVLNATSGPGAIGDRLMLRFTAPGDIRGTGFLVWEHPGDDERFLYLPSLGRVRRITGAEAQESFVGSDFTYEDIGGREFGEYTYRLLEEQDSWTAPGGDRRAAYRLESRRKDPSSRYPRVVSLVLKDSFVVVHSDIYNRRDEREKAYDVRRLDRVEGIWTALESVMANELDRTRTELMADRVDYNTGLQIEDFSRRELERGGR